MKAALASILTLLLLTLSGCTGTENKVDLELPAAQAVDGDGDKDGVPDAAEAALCSRSVTATALKVSGLGPCDGTNWHPIQAPVDAFVPTLVTIGPDADNDLVPAYVRVDLTNLRVNVFSAERLVIGETRSVILPADPDDGDAQNPDGAVGEKPLGFWEIPMKVTLGDDKDGDALPATIDLRLVKIEFEQTVEGGALTLKDSRDLRVPLDLWDDDAQWPVISLVTVGVPSSIYHTGDGDNDRLPGELVIEWLTVNVDRRAATAGGPSLVYLGAAETRTTIDGDDTDRDNMVPLSLVDRDGDILPDAAEPLLCMVEDRYDDKDGYCVGDNYHLPALGEALDIVLGLVGEGGVLDLELGARINSLGDASETNEAPGAALAVTLASILALAGLVRRRF